MKDTQSSLILSTFHSSRPDRSLSLAQVVSFNVLGRWPEVLSGKEDAYEGIAESGSDSEGLLQPRST